MLRMPGSPPPMFPLGRVVYLEPAPARVCALRKHLLFATKRSPPPLAIRWLGPLVGKRGLQALSLVLLSKLTEWGWGL